MVDWVQSKPLATIGMALPLVSMLKLALLHGGMNEVFHGGLSSMHLTILVVRLVEAHTGVVSLNELLVKFCSAMADSSTNHGSAPWDETTGLSSTIVVSPAVVRLFRSMADHLQNDLLAILLETDPRVPKAAGQELPPIIGALFAHMVRET